MLCWVPSSSEVSPTPSEMSIESQRGPSIWVLRFVLSSKSSAEQGNFLLKADWNWVLSASAWPFASVTSLPSTMRGDTLAASVRVTVTLVQNLFFAWGSLPLVIRFSVWDQLALRSWHWICHLRILTWESRSSSRLTPPLVQSVPPSNNLLGGVCLFVY